MEWRPLGPALPEAGSFGLLGQAHALSSCLWHFSHQLATGFISERPEHMDGGLTPVIFPGLWLYSASLMTV